MITIKKNDKPKINVIMSTYDRLERLRLLNLQKGQVSLLMRNGIISEDGWLKHRALIETEIEWHEFYMPSIKLNQ